MGCHLIWSGSATPAGRSLFRLLPLERTICEPGSGWLPTLVASDAKGRSYKNTWKQRTLRDALETQGAGRLSPEWAAWFMGYPAAHWQSGLTAMQYIRRSRKKSSAR